MDDPSGWLWVLMDVVGVVMLAAALIYGIMMWRDRCKDWAMKQAQEEVTCENYRQGG